MSSNYCMHSNLIQKIHHSMFISRGCPWVSMKRGGCKFGGSKTWAVHGQKGGALVLQLVLKLKESVAPSPPPGVRYKAHGANVTRDTSPFGGNMPEMICPRWYLREQNLKTRLGRCIFLDKGSCIFFQQR